MVAKVVDGTVDKALANEDYIKGIITAVAQKFSADEPADLSLVLPESLKAALEPFVKNELGKLLGKGVDATFSKKVAGGFKIGPKDGGYFVSLTDDTFKDLIGTSRTKPSRTSSAAICGLRRRNSCSGRFLDKLEMTIG